MDELANGKTEGGESRRRNSIELHRVEADARDSNLSNQPAKAPYSRPEVMYSPEKTTAVMTCLKIVLIAFNIIIWLFGVVITGVGIWLAVDPSFGNFQVNLDMTHYKSAAYVAIAVGVIIITLGLIGCFGAIKQSLCCLSLSIIIALLIVVLEIVTVGIVWSALSNKDTQDKIASLIRKEIEKRKDNPASVEFIDKMQNDLKCCGIKNAAEYEGVLPRSCLDDEGQAYKRGCMTLVIDFFKDKSGILGGIAVTTLLFQITALTLSICLICTIRQGRKEVF